MQTLTARGIEPHEINVKAELQRTGILAQVGGKEFIHHLIFCTLSRPAQPNHPGHGFDPCYTIPLVRSLKLRRDLLAKARALAQAALDFSKPLQVEL